MEKRMLIFTNLFWLSLSGYTNTAESSRSVFILAGQSNMVGAGGVVNNAWDGFVPSECQPSPRILRLTDRLAWEVAAEPLHQYGIGPGMSFANSLLKISNVGEIGLVPCAVGGTKISQWMRGTDLYNRILAHARAAVSGGGGGEIRALIWYQGESDTTTYDDAVAYRGRLVQFITDLRSDLQSPSLPVILVALASGGGGGFTETVRKGQLESGVQNARCVDAKGLELQPDRLHLTTAAQVQLGAMLADAYVHTVGGLG